MNPDDYDDDGNNIVPCPICMSKYCPSKYCPSKEDGKCPGEDMFALEGEIRMLLSEYKETGDNSRIVNVLEAVEHLLTEKAKELQKAREDSGKRNAVVKEYKDEDVMFVLKVEDGKTYEASMPIPKWGEVGKLQLRDQSELDQPK